MTTATAEDVDLELLLSDVAPCDWQRGHQHSGTRCLDVATTLMWQGCTPEVRYRACASAAAFVRECMRVPFARCMDCNRPCATCWRIVPI